MTVQYIPIRLEAFRLNVWIPAQSLPLRKQGAKMTNTEKFNPDWYNKYKMKLLKV